MTDGRRRILLTPEYSVGIPLWDRSDRRTGFLPDEAGISEELLERLRSWNSTWEDANPPERPSRWSSREFDRWKELGNRLARQLQAELPDVEILLHDDGGYEVPVNERW